MKLVRLAILFAIGFFLGVGVVSGTNATTLDPTPSCLATQSGGGEDDFLTLNPLCSGWIRFTFKSKTDGGKLQRCEPVRDCVVTYDVDGSWAEDCIDSVTIWTEGVEGPTTNLPPGMDGPGANATTDFEMACPTLDNSVEFQFKNNGQVIMNIFFELNCFLCPVVPG